MYLYMFGQRKKTLGKPPRPKVHYFCIHLDYVDLISSHLIALSLSRSSFSISFLRDLNQWTGPDDGVQFPLSGPNERSTSVAGQAAFAMSALAVDQVMIIQTLKPVGPLTSNSFFLFYCFHELPRPLPRLCSRSATGALGTPSTWSTTCA